MKKALKVAMVILMILGIVLSIINFVSVENVAMTSEKDGSVSPEGCKGDSLNC